MRIYCRSIGGAVTVEANPSDPIRTLKIRISCQGATLPNPVPASAMLLTLEGRVLEDNVQCCEYGIKHGNTLHFKSLPPVHEK